MEYYTVKEAGINLSRLLYHLENNDVAFITAFRHNLSKNENIQRNKKLALDIYNIKLSFIKIMGSYTEEKIEKATVEDSFAVIHNYTNIADQDTFFNEMIGLCNKYNQDSVLISLKDRKDIPCATYNRKKEIVYGPFNGLTTQNIENFFSKIHGHNFKMKEFNESIESNNVKSFNNAAAYYSTKQILKMLSNI